MNTDTILLHLSLIGEIGPSFIQTVVDKKESIALDALYGMNIDDAMHHYGCSRRTAEILVPGLSSTKMLEKELDLLEKNAINWMTIQDFEYPQLLKKIYAPPPILYWLGAPILGNDMFSIIGSRKADEYAQKVIDAMVPALVKNNWTIVSGGALGADTMAHRATLRSGGKTVAVIGSGLLYPYPRSNKKLFEEIIEKNGTVLSIFPLTLHGLPANFPIRNRIISGLSRGLLVVQAAAKSGTQITAHYALDQGRDVFAVPGQIDHELSVGCHALIQQGAQLVTNAADILREYGQTAQTPLFKPAVAQQLSLESCLESHQSSMSLAEKVLAACKNPMSIDDLMGVTGQSLDTLSSLLFELQLEGSIEQHFTGKWQSRH